LANRAPAVEYIYALISLEGLGLHFICPFASHHGEMHVACQKADCPENPGSACIAKHIPPSARWFVHRWKSFNLGTRFSIKVTRY